jgi:hypothetical protein
MSCALGPGGAYYVSSPGIGQARSGLDSRLEREILRRLNEEKLFVGDPASVTLGIKGSYVLVGKKGDIFWDLKGEYTRLDNMLQSSEVGVEASTLQPSLEWNFSTLPTPSNAIASRQSLCPHSMVITGMFYSKMEKNIGITR